MTRPTPINPIPTPNTPPAHLERLFELLQGHRLEVVALDAGCRPHHLAGVHVRPGGGVAKVVLLLLAVLICSAAPRREW